MPTQRVESHSSELLQNVADSLLKAKKVVVVTGAGISTNSGIPDFRSENGLYSLIQAQFETAISAKADQDLESTPSSQPEESFQSDHDEQLREEHGERSSKRRKTSHEQSPDRALQSQEVKEEIKVQLNLSSSSTIDYQEMRCQESIIVCRPVLAKATQRLGPDSQKPRLANPSLPHSPPSSRTDFRSTTPPQIPRLPHMAHPHLSSPLSSPPTVIFDPFREDSSDRKSTSPSELGEDEGEVEEADSPCKALSSVATQSKAATLPNMKGKDLFDVSIWSDPLRTSVFYTFATSLRQKIKQVQPTTSHRFISHLRDRGKLVRCYTQNIDQIEEKVGLSTTLADGPGSRGRFSRRSTANAATLSKMVEEISAGHENKTPPGSQPTGIGEPAESSQSSTSASESASLKGEIDASRDQSKPTLKREKSSLVSGVECVFLHGSLDQLRCFVCHKVCTWDDEDRELATLSGQQPQCPHCLGATVAREERGKRSLGVGKLRPDIVLYGEEHPNAHLISPIVTHDLGLNPDLLLILGTSLRVHGLKVMVREFAKAVHNRGGKVVFVNFTKPPESAWGDVIDYWIQWDCDAWVEDLQGRIPKLWSEPDAPKLSRKRISEGKADEPVLEGKACLAKNPAAIRDTKKAGAYWTMKIVGDLHKITGVPQQRRASISGSTSQQTQTSSKEENNGIKVPRVAKRKSRKSAPGELTCKKSSTLNPDHGRKRKLQDNLAKTNVDQNPQGTQLPALSTIINSVKTNPRVRKRKTIDGEEVVLPFVGTKKSLLTMMDLSLVLPPLRRHSEDRKSASRFGKPLAREPRSPPTGPLCSISPNLRSAKIWGKEHSFFIQNSLKGPVGPMVRAIEPHNVGVDDYLEGMKPRGNVGARMRSRRTRRRMPAETVG